MNGSIAPFGLGGSIWGEKKAICQMVDVQGVPESTLSKVTKRTNTTFTLFDVDLDKLYYKVAKKQTDGTISEDTFLLIDLNEIKCVKPLMVALGVDDGTSPVFGVDSGEPLYGFQDRTLRSHVSVMQRRVYQKRKRAVVKLLLESYMDSAFSNWTPDKKTFRAHRAIAKHVFDDILRTRASFDKWNATSIFGDTPIESFLREYTQYVFEEVYDAGKSEFNVRNWREWEPTRALKARTIIAIIQFTRNNTNQRASLTFQLGTDKKTQYIRRILFTDREGVQIKMNIPNDHKRYIPPYKVRRNEAKERASRLGRSLVPPTESKTTQQGLLTYDDVVAAAYDAYNVILANMYISIEGCESSRRFRSAVELKPSRREWNDMFIVDNGRRRLKRLNYFVNNELKQSKRIPFPSMQTMATWDRRRRDRDDYVMDPVYKYRLDHDLSNDADYRHIYSLLHFLFFDRVLRTYSRMVISLVAINKKETRFIFAKNNKSTVQFSHTQREATVCDLVVTDEEYDAEERKGYISMVDIAGIRFRDKSGVFFGAIPVNRSRERGQEQSNLLDYTEYARNKRDEAMITAVLNSKTGIELIKTRYMILNAILTRHTTTAQYEGLEIPDAKVARLVGDSSDYAYTSPSFRYFRTLLIDLYRIETGVGPDDKLVTGYRADDAIEAHAGKETKTTLAILYSIIMQLPMRTFSDFATYL